MPFTEETYLRQKARNLSAGLASRLEEFVQDISSGQSSKNLTRTVRVFLERIDAQLAITDDIRILRWHCLLIDNLAESLEWLDHADAAQVPKACIEILNEISRVVPDGAGILVTPVTESNYFITDWRPIIRNLTNALPENDARLVMACLPTPLYRVQFPRIEKENILNHALFGHEFGHPIVDEFFSTHETSAEYKERFQRALIEAEQEAEIAEELAGYTDEVDRARVKTNISETLSEIHKRAVEELTADAVAVYLFGPSAIFSAIDLFIRHSLDESPEYDEFYPPTRYRWRFMYQILKEEGYIDALKNLSTKSSSAAISTLNTVIQYLEESISKNSDRDALQIDPLTKVAYAWLEMTLPESTKYAVDRTKKFKYTVEALKAEVPALLERLEIGVPPSEVGAYPESKPVDWRSSLIAGCIIALHHTSGPSSFSEEDRKKLLVTYRLTEKGIEYIFLRRQFEEYRSRAEAAA